MLIFGRESSRSKGRFWHILLPALIATLLLAGAACGPRLKGRIVVHAGTDVLEISEDSARTLATNVSVVAVSPDRRYLLYSGSDSISLLDLQTSEVKIPLQNLPNPASMLSWSPDSTRFSFVSDCALHVSDLAGNWFLIWRAPSAGYTAQVDNEHFGFGSMCGYVDSGFWITPDRLLFRRSEDSIGGFGITYAPRPSRATLAAVDPSPVLTDLKEDSIVIDSCGTNLLIEEGVGWNRPIPPGHDVSGERYGTVYLAGVFRDPGEFHRRDLTRQRSVLVKQPYKPPQGRTTKAKTNEPLPDDTHDTYVQAVRFLPDCSIFRIDGAVDRMKTLYFIDREQNTDRKGPDLGEIEILSGPVINRNGTLIAVAEFEARKRIPWIVAIYDIKNGSRREVWEKPADSTGTFVILAWLEDPPSSKES